MLYRINQIAQESKCIRLVQDETARLDMGGYLYTGILESLDSEAIVENYSLIPPGQTYIARDLTILCKILNFKQKHHFFYFFFN